MVFFAAGFTVATTVGVGVGVADAVSEGVGVGVGVGVAVATGVGVGVGVATDAIQLKVARFKYSFHRYVFQVRQRHSKYARY